MNYSIIMPMYNSELYIENILKKFCMLNKTDIELIIVDDGSTDSSSNIVKNYLGNKNIHYYYTEHSGVSDTRNYGLKKVRGNKITFIDSDDDIDFNIMYETFKMANNLSIITPFRNLDNRFNRMTKKEKISYLIYKEEINSPCNKIYDLKVIKKYKIEFIEELNLGEDLLFNLEYYFKCNHKIVINKHRYYNYIKRNNSLTTKYRSNKIYNLLNVYNILQDYNKNNNMNAEKAINSIYIKNFYSCFRDISYNSLNNYNDAKLELIELKKLFEYKKQVYINYKFLEILFLLIPNYIIYKIFKLKKKVFK